MLDFEVQRFTRRCAATERELRPGEAFYSVLVPDGAQVERLDYCVDAWQGPPENSLGWWKAEVPDIKAKKLHWAPRDVMLHYFQQLQGQADKRDYLYILTLLMIRRRILRLDDTERSPNEEETLIVYCSQNETEYKVTVIQPERVRVEEIQQDLASLLFAKATGSPKTR